MAPPLPLLREARQTVGPPVPTHAVPLPPGSVRLSFGAPGILIQLEPSRTVLRQVLDKLAQPVPQKGERYGTQL